ncbi:MAG TPA: glutamate--tRNA ligase family protein, partial [Paludibacteraceae bacterium]|nr:glutamate--tRNA ligase family protein [Paludibacteraceae bacterium]
DGDRLGFPVFPLDWEDPKTEAVSSGYREAGYFPEAVVNFLALLGWNPGTEQELFSMQELIEQFSLQRVSKSGAKFDYEKGKWFNHKYLQMKPNEELADIYQHILVEKDIIEDSEKVSKVVGLIKERANFVNDLWDQSYYFFQAPTEYDEKSVKKRWKQDTPERMAELIEVIKTIDDFSSANQEAVICKWIEEKGYGMGAILNAFRVAIVGAAIGPHMFDITEIIGKEETIERINRAISFLSKTEDE